MQIQKNDTKCVQKIRRNLQKQAIKAKNRQKHAENACKPKISTM